jgi:hypothetical protein
MFKICIHDGYDSSEHTRIPLPEDICDAVWDAIRLVREGIRRESFGKHLESIVVSFQGDPNLTIVTAKIALRKHLRNGSIEDESVSVECNDYFGDRMGLPVTDFAEQILKEIRWSCLEPANSGLIVHCNDN